MKKTAVTKDGVTVERASDKYKGHIFYDADGTGYKCLGYNPKLDDCIYLNLKTKVEVVGCMDGFYFNKPVEKHKKGATIKGKNFKFKIGDKIKVPQYVDGKLKKSWASIVELYNAKQTDGSYFPFYWVVGDWKNAGRLLYSEEKILNYGNNPNKQNLSKRDKELAEFVNVSYKKGGEAGDVESGYKIYATTTKKGIETSENWRVVNALSEDEAIKKYKDFLLNKLHYDKVDVHKAVNVKEIRGYQKGATIKSSSSDNDDDMEELLFSKHIEEAERKKAEITNLGWGQGDTFIHSKTTKGKLYSEIKNGKVSHKWDEIEYKGKYDKGGNTVKKWSYGIGGL